MKLQNLMEKTSEKTVKCPECRAFGNDIQKKGFRENKREEVQKYFCKKCKRHFVIRKMMHKTYPVNVILNSISFYNRGMSLENASKKVNMKFGIKTSPRLISSWMNEFSDICTFRRVRGKFSCKKGFAFSNPVFEKLIEHKQPYLYKYHKLKIDMFLRDYFSGLKNYLFGVAETCPHELFLQDNLRSSQIRINYATIKKIGVEKKNNYACKLAGLALKMARTNRERHEIVQDFMLSNDTSTLAVEVPIWLSKKEIEKINSELGVFSDVCGNNSNVCENEEITGHIDFVQARYGIIYILDYKPEAERIDAVSQLFTYALALSTRTDIWLRNFRCAWFDEKAYYEFNPNDIVLIHISRKFNGKIPEDELKKYVLNERTKHYFTSLKFQEKRKQETAEEQELKEKWNKEEEAAKKEKEKREKEIRGKGIKGKEKAEMEGIVIVKDKYGKIVGAK